MSGLINLKRQGLENFSFKTIKSNLNINNNKLKKKSNSFKANNDINDNQQMIPIPFIKKVRNNKSISSKFENEKNNDKLYLKNIQLKSKLNKIERDLILAKSASHKKDRELLEKKKLISSAINDINKFNNYDILPLMEINDNLISPLSIDNFKKEREKGIKINYLYKIRKEYLELVKENDIKNKEINNLKNNMKNPDISKLSTKNKEILENLIKIRKEHKIIIEQNSGYKLKMKKYLELKETTTKKNFIILQLQENLKKCKGTNVQYEYEIELLKNKLKSLETENKNLNNQYNLLEENYNNIANNKYEIEKKYELLEFEKNKTLIFFNNIGKQDNINNNNEIIEINNEKNNLFDITETTYILKKNFEALNITKEDFLTNIIKPILNEITNEKQIEKELLVNYFSNKICEYINCLDNENDIININNIINSMLTISENELSKFIENFLHIFDGINNYLNISKENEENIIQNLKMNLNKYKEYFNEIYNKEFISFFVFRGLLKNKEIILEDELIEYLIYRMKKDSKNIIINNNKNKDKIENEEINNNKISEEADTLQSKRNINENKKSIYDLCYKTLLEFIE